MAPCQKKSNVPQNSRAWGPSNSRGAPTLLHFCSLLLSAPVLPVLNSEKLFWEQHSFTFAHFCCPRPPPGAAASAEFREASFGATLFTFAHFCQRQRPSTIEARKIQDLQFLRIRPAGGNDDLHGGLKNPRPSILRISTRQRQRRSAIES